VVNMTITVLTLSLCSFLNVTDRLVLIYQTTWHHNYTSVCNLNIQRYKHLKSHTADYHIQIMVSESNLKCQNVRLHFEHTLTGNLQIIMATILK
jgi:hypothetical protein